MATKVADEYGYIAARLREIERRDWEGPEEARDVRDEAVKDIVVPARLLPPGVVSSGTFGQTTLLQAPPLSWGLNLFVNQSDGTRSIVNHVEFNSKCGNFCLLMPHRQMGQTKFDAGHVIYVQMPAIEMITNTCISNLGGITPGYHAGTAVLPVRFQLADGSQHPVTIVYIGRSNAGVYYWRAFPWI